MNNQCELPDVDVGYLQHGTAPGPFRTEQVRIRQACWPHAGDWEVFYGGKWRRVFVQVKRLFIKFDGEKITVLIEGV